MGLDLAARHGMTGGSQTYLLQKDSNRARPSQTYGCAMLEDLALAMKKPEQFVNKLSKMPYNFKFKGSGPIEHHLGMQFERDEDGTLSIS